MSTELTPVVSSSVKAAGYDEDTQTATIQFHSGGTYEYRVTKDAFDALMAAPSIGKHFHNVFIKSLTTPGIRKQEERHERAPE